MSLTLIFGRPQGGPALCGPYKRVIFNRSSIFSEEHPEPIATHERHNWVTHCQAQTGPQFTRLDIHGLAKLHFQRGAAETNYGPFSAISFVNGVLYVEANVFGFADVAQQDWYCTQDRKHWDTLTVMTGETA